LSVLFGIIRSIGLIELFLLFLVGMNVITFLLYVMDKRRALKNKWRIRESILIFFTLAGGAFGALLAMRIVRHKTKKITFKIFVVLGLILFSIPVIHIVHSLTLDKMIHYVELDFYSENWPSELSGYRIAFMTDIHTTTDEDMAEIVGQLNKRDLDLLLLGGDFSMGNSHYRGTIREIAQVNARDGIFGVEGNHVVICGIEILM